MLLVVGAKKIWKQRYSSVYFTVTLFSLHWAHQPITALHLRCRLRSLSFVENLEHNKFILQRLFCSFWMEEILHFQQADEIWLEKFIFQIILIKTIKWCLHTRDSRLQVVFKILSFLSNYVNTIFICKGWVKKNWQSEILFLQFLNWKIIEIRKFLSLPHIIP